MDSSALVENYRYVEKASVVVPEFYEFYHDMALAVIKTSRSIPRNKMLLY